MRDNMPQPKPRYQSDVHDYSWPNWWSRHPYLAGLITGMVGSTTIATCVELVHLYGGL